MTWRFWLSVGEWLIFLGMVPVILRRRMQPAAALAWLALLFFQPLIGVVLYMLIGSDVLGRRRRRLHRKVILRKRKRMPLETVLTPVQQDRQAPIVAQTERVFGMPSTEGNDVELLGEHQQFIDRMIEDIGAAQRTVHMIFYIYEPDEVGRRMAEAMMSAAKRGVKVRILADAAGSRAIFKRRWGGRGLAAQMTEAGVQIHPALPVSPFRRRLARIDLRNHRKLLVIDGLAGYTGSHNICIPSYDPEGEFKSVDLSVRVTGRAVAQMQVVFAEDWAFETDEDLPSEELFTGEVAKKARSEDNEPASSTRIQTVPSGPDEEALTFRRVLLATINSARERLVLTTPYFIPDEPTLLALSLAVHRGVDVHVVVSRRTDYALVTAAGRSYFERLLEEGVRVSLYKPALLHAKTMTIDDSFALLGTANIDVRSFVLNFELNLLLYGEAITRRLHEVQMRYISESEPLELQAWRSRPVLGRYLDDAAALFSPLL